MAEWKGLEPSTFRVTGGRSNQLNYHSKTYSMEPTIGIEPITYRLQGDCSANWAKSAYTVLLFQTIGIEPIPTPLKRDCSAYWAKLRYRHCYAVCLANAFATLDFFLPAVFFLITPTFWHLSMYLYTLSRSPCESISFLVMLLRNFLIAIFILSLNSLFLFWNTRDLLAAFFADFVIGILMLYKGIKHSI